MPNGPRSGRRRQPSPAAPQIHHRLAEVELDMARRVMRGNESLARRLPPRTHIVLRDGVAARRASPAGARRSSAPCAAACAAQPGPSQGSRRRHRCTRPASAASPAPSAVNKRSIHANNTLVTPHSSCRSAQRLSASKIDSPFSKASTRFEPLKCSTPFGIKDRFTYRVTALLPLDDVLNAFRHQRSIHMTILRHATNLVLCSTPFGIKDRFTSL